MKSIKKLQPLHGVATLLGALSLVSCGSESDDDSAAIPENDAVAAQLDGHLQVVGEDTVEPFSWDGGKPEFYVLYYSASW